MLLWLLIPLETWTLMLTCRLWQVLILTCRLRPEQNNDQGFSPLSLCFKVLGLAMQQRTESKDSESASNTYLRQNIGRLLNEKRGTLSGSKTKTESGKRFSDVHVRKDKKSKANSNKKWKTWEARPCELDRTTVSLITSHFGITTKWWPIGASKS